MAFGSLFIWNIHKYIVDVAKNTKRTRFTIKSAHAPFHSLALPCTSPLDPRSYLAKEPDALRSPACPCVVSLPSLFELSQKWQRSRCIKNQSVAADSQCRKVPFMNKEALSVLWIWKKSRGPWESTYVPAASVQLSKAPGKAIYFKRELHGSDRTSRTYELLSEGGIDYWLQKSCTYVFNGSPEM